MVAPYGSAGTQLGHCTVQVQCRTRILRVHLMDKPWSQCVCVIGDVLRMRLGEFVFYCENGLCLVSGVHGCTIWEWWDTAGLLHSAGTV
jgi:hypothetical protein